MLGDLGTGDDSSTVRIGGYKMIAPGFSLDDEYDARPNARHSLSVNIGFMDGHQKPMRLDQFYVGQQPENRFLEL